MAGLAAQAGTGAEIASPDGVAGTWPARPLLLAALCALAALAIQQLSDVRTWPVDAERVALALAIGTAAFAFALVAERLRLVWSIGFALILGAVAGAIFYWHGSPAGNGDFWRWRGISLLLGLAVAIPLFQAARDEGAWRFPYPALHGHAWTDAVMVAASGVFVGIVFLMSWLLAMLFKLIKIDAVEQLLEEHWFAAMLAGAAFGGAISLLRERDRIVRLLQRVVTAVLGVLAPVLGVGLLVFLASLPFTGLGTLWETTRSTTPILLSCAIGAVILANAVIGNGDGDAARNPVLRWSAIVLCVTILPLVVIAAVAIGLRIGQYGYTPERLWALTFIIIASAYGFAYLVALVRGRMAWSALVRSANTRLAFIVVAVALFLATPLLSFNAISTDDQVARLTSGRIAPDKFDWAALAFDFGPPGRAALKRLSVNRNAVIAGHANLALKADTRWDLKWDQKIENSVNEGAAALAQRVRILPRPMTLPDGLLRSFEIESIVKDVAVLWYEPGASWAVLVIHACDKCALRVQTTHRDATGEWKGLETSVAQYPDFKDNELEALGNVLAKKGFELRPVQRRQVFIDGKPIGDPFE